MKRESGEWRENTEKESSREIRAHLVAELGDVQFDELTPALLRAVLKKKAEQGLRRRTLDHLKGYLTDICKTAAAEGYLQNIGEGLKAPVKSAKPADAKLFVCLEQYAQAWKLRAERERICFCKMQYGAGSQGFSASTSQSAYGSHIVPGGQISVAVGIGRND
jgi:hypothetical protein